ncbi:MAG: helix-turn-helix domain-containing protein [Planctomycetota bacterium]|nr:helix-turn-helix domain-containing protein [Planctomycetota bacterium]
MRGIERLVFHFHGGGWATLPPGATFGPRKLKDYEFLWVLEGRVRVKLDDWTSPLEPGSVVLARDGMVDYYDWDPDRQTRCVYMHFYFEPVAELAPPPAEWPKVRHLPDGDVIRPLIQHVMWMLDARREAGREQLQQAMRLLLTAYLTGDVHTRAETARELPEPVHLAFRFMRQRFARDELEALSLPELAKAAGVSEGHLCRLFRQAVGCGPLKALRLMRVDRAATILAESNLKVREVAALTGFENAFHFSRCFKEAFNVSPRAYRQRQREGKVVPQTRLRMLRTLAGPF